MDMRTLMDGNTHHQCEIHGYVAIVDAGHLRGVGGMQYVDSVRYGEVADVCVDHC